ncbi:unnamed protein product [Polarella glacialis]|uniref:Uncharacterized protein n=1 Tax=Polarella glacialis TaxID=89957 RepID=A0A813D9X6_POLGL|nr:unnamed protein product [Polarella glacialis]
MCCEFEMSSDGSSGLFLLVFFWETCMRKWLGNSVSPIPAARRRLSAKYLGFFIPPGAYLGVPRPPWRRSRSSAFSAFFVLGVLGVLSVPPPWRRSLFSAFFVQ